MQKYVRAAEGLKLFNKNYKNGIGVDRLIKMLNNAYYSNNKLNYQLLQGDAINLPLKDNVLDCVLIWEVSTISTNEIYYIKK